MKVTTEQIISKRGAGQMVAGEFAAERSWLRWDRCPIIPHIRWRTGNEQNTWSFGIHWLIFRAWTMDSPDIGAEISLDDMGFQARIRIPYLITGLFVPLFPWRMHQKLWRRPKRKHSDIAC